MAQRHMAKINKYRGEYDKWGNRLTKSYLNVRHLLEDETSQNRTRDKRGKKMRAEEQLNDLRYEEEELPGDEFQLTDYNISRKLPVTLSVFEGRNVSARPDQLTLSPRRHEVTHRLQDILRARSFFIFHFENLQRR